MGEQNIIPLAFLEPYNAKESEPRILELWEKSGFANPDVCIEKGVTAPDAEPYSIVLPPPNVTGTLHMGHAAMLAIQDILIRYHRMRGDRTLWLPGTDHAAIATQSVVEKELLKKEKKTRHDLGREEFLKKVEEFAQASHDRIVGQVRAMGASVDWSREAYTLDEARNLAVRTAFKKMYDAGLIYRGNRIVNWDPKMQTTVSDDEIVHEEREAKLVTFKYAKDFPIAIATTRLETKVGDTAVAVHPDDARYKKYIDKEYDVDFAGVPLHLKVVGDESVDPAFGTGAVGVTPGHSHTDWEIAKRHGLPLSQVIDERARMLTEGALKGKKTLEAREGILAWLKENNLFVKEEDITQNIATAERTGGIVEPIPKLQWFVDVNKKFTIPYSEIPGIASGSETSLKEIMRHAVDSGLPASRTDGRTRQAGAIKIAPDRFERVYYNWIDNLRDWCISRQIWYGHRIPVWYCLNCKHEAVDAEVKARWFLVRHGETEGNVKRITQGHQDTPLTKQGIEQARAAGEQLKNQDIELIISSDLGRCRQTAEIIAQATGAEVMFDAGFRERFMGDAEGMSYEEQEVRFRPFKDYDDRTDGNMETTRELEERVAAAFAKHRKVHGHRSVVIVSHGGAMRWLVKRIKNLTFEEAKISKVAGNAEVQSLDVLQTSCHKCGNDLFEQDPDTLDTWFSSGLWTFSTLGWPEKRMGFAGDIVSQVFDKKTKTYRLRDHGFKVGDVVAFEDGSTQKIFGYGTINSVTVTNVGKINLKDKAHWKTYEKVEELIATFKRHHPDKNVTTDTPVWIYSYSFDQNTNRKSDLATYHPTSVLETGYDILFFWVARMVLMTGFLLGTIPFRNVYLHGLVRDARGRKMSKSLGNVIDPLTMIEKYGADAARLSLIVGASPGNDVKLSEDRVRGYKHFANKVWNISRFVLENVEQTPIPSSSRGATGQAQKGEIGHGVSNLVEADKKLLAESQGIAKTVSENIDNFRLDLAADTLYHFIWHRFADEIIEESKPILKLGGETSKSRRHTLYAILHTSLRLLHPFMPFVTEAIWQNLPQKEADILMVARWPSYNT